MQKEMLVAEPYCLNKAASQQVLTASLINKVMRVEALAHVGVNELLLEAGEWDTPTVHHFSLLADLTSQCRELAEVVLLKLGQGPEPAAQSSLPAAQQDDANA